MKPILIDSGPFIALFDSDDRFHNEAVSFIKSNHRPLITTVANITEAIHVLEFSKKAQSALLRWLSSSSIKIEEIGADDLGEIADLFEKYSDVPMDFADACIVYACEKNGTNEIAFVDSDFEIYRLKGKKPFRNLLNIKQKKKTANNRCN